MMDLFKAAAASAAAAYVGLQGLEQLQADHRAFLSKLHQQAVRSGIDCKKCARIQSAQRNCTPSTS